jgi:hypothetical protein
MAIDVTAYWLDAPPEPSPKLNRWLDKIRGGWRPNARIRTMGYHEASEFYGVYIWEYLNVIVPAIEAAYQE